MKDSTKGSASASVSYWVLALAATAGLGVGVGASFAASRGQGKARGREAVSDVADKATATPVERAVPAAPVPAPAQAAAPLLPVAAEVASDVIAAAPQADARVVDSGAVEALVSRLGAAHARIHAPAESAALEQALEQALDEVFARKGERRFAKEFYAAFGIGRFARGGALTALGTAVVERARSVEIHALDPGPYDLPGLETAVAGVGKAAAEGAARPELGALAGLLEAPVWDASAARERLAALSSLPPESAVDEATAALAGGRSATAADARLDVRVYRAFFDLVMDFRFVHRAGPFKITGRDAVLERERKEVKDFMATVLAGDGQEALALLDPPHPQYRKMVEQLAEYRRMAAAEPGCPKLSAGWRFRSGARGEEVKKLQQRLTCEGFYAGEIDGRFEGATVEAVKSYQRHHYLPDEGTVLEETMASLNVPLARRVQQIELALQRMREAPLERMTDFFIRVNIPAFELTVYEKGAIVRRHRVIVGTNRLDDDKVQLVQGHINRTKLFGTRLYEVIVNPTWILPKRVEEGELQSSLEKDEAYLEKSNIKKVKLGSGTEVFVQGAGKGNVLGKVKFLLEGTNAIYLHDTDKRHLFKKQRRDFSHGCMRVHEAIDFGRWLLAHDGFSQAEIDRAFGLDSLQTGFDLKKPVDFVTEYITVDLSEEGRPVFHEDIYGYDAAYFNDKLPPNEKTRWGSSILRPRWVPVMDGETVEGWRKAGKAAPRNLGPDGKPKPDAGKGGDAEIDQGP